MKLIEIIIGPVKKFVCTLPWLVVHGGVAFPAVVNVFEMLEFDYVVFMDSATGFDDNFDVVRVFFRSYSAGFETVVGFRLGLRR